MVESLSRFEPSRGRTLLPAADEVHVITLDVQSFRGSTGRFGAVLDNQERVRATRFAREADRDRFVIAHGATREILASYLGTSPAALSLAPGTNGKPRIRETPVDIRFSLAHSADRILVAVAVGREVGVDVEQERPIQEMQLAARFFSRAECRALVRAADRRAAFFRCWTRKESLVKARGDGLSFPLSEFDVSVAPAGRPLFLGCEAAPSELARWLIRSVPVGSGYAAAVTAEGQDWHLVICS